MTSIEYIKIKTKTMTALAAISKIDFPYKVEQQKVKEGARKLFAPSYPQVERMISAFDNTKYHGKTSDENQIN